MSFFQIFIFLVLALIAYYILLIGKEIIRKATKENDNSKGGDDEEIDIGEDLMHFDVTEIDPNAILVDDTIVRVENNLSEENSNSDKNVPVNTLPFPIDVKEFYKLVMAYNPEQPNPDLEAIVFQVSNGVSTPG